MEINEGLFEIKDKDGVCVWDLVRYYVFVTLMWTEDQAPSTETKWSIKRVIAVLSSFVLNLWIVLFVRRKYFFFLHSRNRHPKNGLFFDQNAFNTINLFNPKECLINECYNVEGRDIYDSIIRFKQSGLLYRLFVRNTPEYDYNEIKNCIDKYFTNNNVSLERLNSEYKSFYAEKRFYKMVFRKTSTKLLFVTQAGIRKGVFAAAEELAIPSIEFNHGIVYNGHMAYSYPKIDNIVNYNADYIFSLSDFWFQDMFLPNTKVLSVGNDYFVPKCIPNSSPEADKTILVVSSDVMGLALKDFMIDMFENNPESLRYKYIFKLHPNQFEQREAYEDYFRNYSNVVIITNEKSVPECLLNCATMLVIQSTAAFEALQMKRKVVVYKRLSFDVMPILFDNSNVYLVDNAIEFLHVLSLPIKDDHSDFFVAYDSNKAIKYIDFILNKSLL